MDVEREFERFVEGAANLQPARDEHRRELRSRVLAAMPSAPGSEIVLPQSKWRSIMNSPWTRWSATATVVLLAAVLVSLYAAHSPSAAWADVNAVLNHAKELSLEITVYQGENVRTQETISFLAPDRMRVDAKGGSAVIDWGEGKILTLVPRQKLAIKGMLKDDNTKSQQRNWIAHLKEIVGSKNADQIGTKTFEGHTCNGWRVINKLGNTTVWADVKTDLLVRVEMTMKSGDVKTVMSDFRFDLPLDESLFSLEVPEGYHVLAEATVSSHDNALDGLLLLLRAWAGGNGGVFPDSLSDVTDWFSASGKYDWSQETEDKATMQQMIGQAFYRINANQNWVYSGKGVKVGDAKKPVFWQPVSGGKCQVIYGDFDVRTVDEKELQE